MSRNCPTCGGKIKVAKEDCGIGETNYYIPDVPSENEIIGLCLIAYESEDNKNKKVDPALLVEIGKILSKRING